MRQMEDYQKIGVKEDRNEEEERIGVNKDPKYRGRMNENKDKRVDLVKYEKVGIIKNVKYHQGKR